MKLELHPIASNMNELIIDGANILFSYNTPVAAHIAGRGYVKTKTHYSATTSRHINKWLGGVDAEVVDQSEIDGLVGGGK